LEGHLGQTWAGKIKPENIEELGALVSLIRPACLRARSGNPPKSMTERYRDRKLGVEEVDDFDVPELQTILHNTYLIIVYQEDAMQIAVSLAGFNEQDADILRKAIGKKKADVMSQVENNFLLGCEKTAIISKEKAKEIFSWIREAQKYGFNKCLSPTTVVDTTCGIKLLDELNIGDYVKAPSDEYNDEYIEVINIYNNTQELYEITLESGKKIQCSLDHKFLCQDGNKYQLSTIIQRDLSIMCEDGV